MRLRPGSAGRSHARNTAYFLGALGMTLGGLGGGFAALMLARVVIPDGAGWTPGWVTTAFVVGLLVYVIGAWPLCDWLTNRGPEVGRVVMLVLAGVMSLLGGAAILLTALGAFAWLAVVGGLLLGAAGVLASLGGGTDPLTGTALNRSVVGNATWRRLDRRATAALAVVVAVISSLSLLLLRDRLAWSTVAAAIVALVSAALALRFLRWRR